jgi:hypothetical protein
MTRRAGRGRLSSIELLPPDAEPVVAWAMGELRERKHTQIDILEEFNKRLRGVASETGATIEPISLSAFNRYAIRLAATARRLEETREIAATITKRLGPDQADDLTVLAAETIKVLIFELLEGSNQEGGDEITTKGAMELARALHSAVSAQHVSSERRRRIEKDFATQAAKAIDQVSKSEGLSQAVIEAIKSRILGVKGKPS